MSCPSKTHIQNFIDVAKANAAIFKVNFRHGGDVLGLIDKLDYIQALGARNILLLGSPFANMPVSHSKVSFGSARDLTAFRFSLSGITMDITRKT